MYFLNWDGGVDCCFMIWCMGMIGLLLEDLFVRLCFKGLLIVVVVIFINGVVIIGFSFFNMIKYLVINFVMWLGICIYIVIKDDLCVKGFLF